MALNLKNILKGILIGGGGILSCIPAIGPLIGSAVMTVGAAINTKSTGTTDAVTVAANALLNSQVASGNMLAAGKASLTTSNIIDWIKNNVLIFLALCGGAVLLIMKLFKRRKR